MVYFLLRVREKKVHIPFKKNMKILDLPTISFPPHGVHFQFLKTIHPTASWSFYLPSLYNSTLRDTRVVSLLQSIPNSYLLSVKAKLIHLLGSTFYSMVTNP